MLFGYVLAGLRVLSAVKSEECRILASEPKWSTRSRGRFCFARRIQRDGLIRAMSPGGDAFPLKLGQVDNGLVMRPACSNGTQYSFST